MTHHGIVFVCPEHRHASHWNACKCGNNIFMSPRWRAPKKTNDRAWKMIQNGEFLWDKKAIARKETRSQERLAAYWAALKRKNPKIHIPLRWQR